MTLVATFLTSTPAFSIGPMGNLPARAPVQLRQPLPLAGRCIAAALSMREDATPEGTEHAAATSSTADASTKPPEEGSGRKSKAGAEHKPAGKGPTDAMRRVCRDRGVKFEFSVSTNYKI